MKKKEECTKWYDAINESFKKSCKSQQKLNKICQDFSSIGFLCLIRKRQTKANT